MERKYSVFARMPQGNSNALEMNETEALNLARSALLAVSPMEETSADLHAMNFLKQVTPNQPMFIHNNSTLVDLVFEQIV